MTISASMSLQLQKHMSETPSKLHHDMTQATVIISVQISMLQSQAQRQCTVLSQGKTQHFHD